MIDVLFQDFAHRIGGHVDNMLGPQLAAALYQRDNRIFLRDRPAIVDIAGLAADECFVTFNNLAIAAHVRAVLAFRLHFHRFANAHRKEPCALIGDAKHAVELVARNTFLAGGHQIKAEHPLRERYLAALHHRIDGHGEGLAAVVAPIDAGARALAFEFLYILGIAVSARDAVRPTHAFEMRASRCFVVENRMCQVNGHDTIPLLLS